MTASNEDSRDPGRSTEIRITSLALLGAAAGFLSGLFGVGGGIIIVPLLLILGMDQRRAAGTSVAAILPAAIFGATSYAVAGNVDWIAAGLLAIGIIAGALVGSWLLSRIPQRALFLVFLVFLAGVTISLWFTIPSRDAAISLTFTTGALLVLLGVITGVISGVMGVGGGIVVVPVLVVLFGASDVIAKGTSLVMMIPGSLSGTMGNLRRQNVDMRAALLIGLIAACVSPLGVWVSHLISPLASNIAFSILLTAVLAQLIVKNLRSARRAG